MVRNIVGFIAGLIVGSLVNYALVMINIVLMPAGVDMMSPDGVGSAMAQMGAVNYIVIFLAHALGTLAGAAVAAAIATSSRFPIAMSIGALFLLGGIYAAYLIPAPLWFEAADVLLAYIPFAYLGAKLGGAAKAR